MLVRRWNRFPRDLGIAVPGNVQGQIGQGLEQPDVAEIVPAHCSGAGLDGLPVQRRACKALREKGS